MLLNRILCLFQNLFKQIYNKSYLLQTIDNYIGICILILIIMLAFAPSDILGYIAIFVILLTFIKLITKTGQKIELDISDILLLVYFVLITISLAGSSLFFLSLKGYMKTLTYLGFYISIIQYFKDNADKIKYVFLAYVLSVSFESVVAFLQNFASVQEISGWQDTSRLNPEEVMTRVYGTLRPFNPNLFGGFLVATIPTFISMFNKNKIFSILGIIISTIAILFTGCRGSYIAMFIEFIVLFIIILKNIKAELKKKFLLIFGSLFVFISTIILSLPALHARILSIFAMRGDSSNSFRFNVYNSCLNMLKDNWILGIGIGNQNFREIYGLYMKTGFDALSAYNIYLEMAVESGIFALIAFLAFLFYIIKNGLKKCQSPYVLAALISMIGLLVHGFVDTVFFRPQIQFTFWIMAAILRGSLDGRK